ncbi:hypothetical protein ACIP5N_27620 [Streptomyces sp. NPDC088768]|uniref:DUF7296 family protein n=1 Tax=Streptomyces sp. NPDC088768 TaxID=3365894 RepID=UPI00381E3F7C
MFFEYRQNNSGGAMDIDDARGIGRIVVIEAHDAKDADRRAEEAGLYFDGIEAGTDCECCGDRWYRASGWYEDQGICDPRETGDPAGAWVHYMDGRTEWNA